MTARKDPADTPVMRQYLAAKERHPDAILFFRMGDFYEMFFDDAVLAAEVLDLALTSRNKNDPDPIPMCGLPWHASMGYLSRLVGAGHKVAICEQMEDPSKVKGLVKREVVRVVTPGVLLDEETLEAKANNFLGVALPATAEADGACALIVLDASTHEFRGTRVAGPAALTAELARLEPRELLVPAGARPAFAPVLALLPRLCVTTRPDELFAADTLAPVLIAHLGEVEARALVDADPLVARAAGAALAYVRETQPLAELPLLRFAPYDLSDFLVLDETTKTHLELTRTMAGERKGSLLWWLDRTRTPMGGRLLRQWINHPLNEVAPIRRRLDRVELFFRDSAFRNEAQSLLERVGDVERLAARVGLGAASPRDLGGLRNALLQLPDLDDLMTSCRDPEAERIIGGPLDRLAEARDVLAAALVDEPPVTARDGKIFRPGFDPELDELVATVRDAKEFIAALEARERQRTGISSLRVTYNKVFGYSIEITKANLKHVPPDFIRRQTLSTGERYVTPELEEWERKVVTADDRRREIEAALFDRLLAELRPHLPRLLAVGHRLAELDVAAGLAETARLRELARPEVDEGAALEILDGRHPLVEALSPEAGFVPNDVRLDPDGERLVVVTGPNMAGKSTVMRQVALTVILAQLGSFVPARAARIGLVDRLFTRIGASDNIARGASTFMVEMRETAAILRHATRRSLVLLDEVGRGTSTIDGLSIAWAVGEFLHDVVGCKVMFATHYHELVELAASRPNAANYHMAAREYGEDVIFLRKLVAGGTSHSFGLQVARMAGLPESVVARAREVLADLEQGAVVPRAGSPRSKRPGAGAGQLDLFARPARSEVERLLAEIDLDRVTPLEALALLARLKKTSEPGPG